MRDLSKVIDRLVVEIPALEVKFKENMLWLKENMAYTPPEAMRANWNIGASFMQGFIPNPPIHAWHWAVLSIWMGKSVEELKGMFK